MEGSVGGIVSGGSITPAVVAGDDDSLEAGIHAAQDDQNDRGLAAPEDTVTVGDDATTAVPEKESLLDKLQALSPEQKALYRGLATAGEVLMARAGQLMINFIR